MKYVFDTNVLFVKKNINEYIKKNIEYKLKGSISKVFKDGDGFITPTVFAEIINQILIEKSKVSIWPIRKEDVKKYEDLYDDLIKKIKLNLEGFVISEFKGHEIPSIILEDLNFFNDNRNFKDLKDRVIAYEASFIKKEYKWDSVTIVTNNTNDFRNRPENIDAVMNMKQNEDIVGSSIIKFASEGDLFGYIVANLDNNLLDGSIDFTDYISVSHSEKYLITMTKLGEFKVLRNDPLSKEELGMLVEKINYISIFISGDIDRKNHIKFLEYKQQQYAEEQAEMYREYQEKLHEEYLEELYMAQQESLSEEQRDDYEQHIADMYS